MPEAAARKPALLFLPFALAAFFSCSRWWSPPPEPTPTPRPTATPTTAATSTPVVSPTATPIGGDLEPLAPEALAPLADDLDHRSLTTVLDRTIDAFAGRGADEVVRFAGRSCPRAAVTAALVELREQARHGRDLAATLRQRFTAHRSVGRTTGPLVTGYYEPILPARRKREGKFDVPIYRRPDDLVEVALADFPGDGSGRLYGRLRGTRLEPYFSRREIDAGKSLAGRRLEIAWIEDPIEAFFLHVQGSGVLRFANGDTQRIGFGASNGHPYTSIGRILLDEGELAPGEATAPGIRRWLRAHPGRAESLLQRNERYVFFREVGEGPIGALNVVLTAGRSVAADPALYPLGSLAWLKTEIPIPTADGRFEGTRATSRLIVVQDTGSAITGPGRIDLFFGTGDAAGAEAGGMASSGDLVFLFPDCK